MELLLLLTYASFFIFIIYRFPFFNLEGISRHAVPVVFIIKIGVGLLLWAIYTFYYTNRATADIYKYFDDSKIMFDALKTRPIHYIKMLFGIQNNTAEFDVYYSAMKYWSRKNSTGTFNDGHTVIRFNALLRLVSMGYYTIHTVFICFISLIGFTAIYKTFIPFFKDKKRELFILVFLLPSVLFWGSGVLKEGLLFFALGLLLYHFQPPYTLKKWCISLIMAFLLALSKFYVWIALLPGLLFLWIIHKSGPGKMLWKFTLVLVFFALLAGTIDRFTRIQSPFVTLSQKQIEFNLLAEGKTTDANHQPIAAAGSYIPIPKLYPTFASFIRNSPVALRNMIFRPYLHELKSPMIALAGIENVLLIAFILICTLFHQPFSAIKWEYVFFCCSFVIIQYLIIGTTTPIIGAIARYKVPSLPFLLIAFLFILDKHALTNRFPLLKKLFPPN